MKAKVMGGIKVIIKSWIKLESRNVRDEKQVEGRIGYLPTVPI